MLELNNLISKISTCLEKTTFSFQEIQNILFLIDWRAALSEKPSISNLDWEIGLDGAYSKNFHEKIRPDSKLVFVNNENIIKINTAFTTNKHTTSDWQNSIINFTTQKIKNLNSEDFNNLVKSLFPMKLEKFTPINLSSIAKDYLNSGVSIQKIDLK